MKNKELSQIWDSQKDDVTLDTPESIIKKAQKQRNGQFITISVLSLTAIIITTYALVYSGSTWNSFTLGLFLMISSLIFRIILEYVTIYRKKSQLLALDNRAFQSYLKKYHDLRLKVNYIITPICFGVYVYGFSMLLPYFKKEFSEGFYTYVLISGIAFLVVLVVIIVKSTLGEQRFLKQLKKG